jgi:FixJ family two-component response regulator
MAETPTVIVVDDDPLIREALGGLIRSVGVHAKTLVELILHFSDRARQGRTALLPFRCRTGFPSLQHFQQRDK